MTPMALEPYFAEWFKLAEPAIQTKDYGINFAEFVRKWKSVKVPLGEDMAMLVADSIDLNDLPSEASRVRGEISKELVALCHGLQQRGKSGEPFFLSCHKAAEVLEISPKHAWSLLGLFCTLGILEVAEKGSQGGGKATRYRYIGGG